MESLCNIGPVIERRYRFGGDLESGADFLEKVVGERCGVVALEGAWKTEVREDVGVECVDDGGCCHVLGGQEPNESTKTIPTGEDITVTVGLGTQLPKEVEVKYLHRLARSC